MWSSRQTTLTLLFAVLGGLAWWLVQRQSESDAPTLVKARTPDYVVSAFQAIETGPTGHPSRRLEAEQMRQYVSEDLAELDQPELTLYQAEGPPWRAQSRQGLVLAGGDEVRLSLEVRIERAGSAGHRPVHLDTTALTIWPQRQFAQGEQPVRVESEGDWLTARGLRLWFAEPVRAEFPGRAHLLIVPEGSRPATRQDNTP